MKWWLLSVAIGANVTANIALKYLAMDARFESSARALATTLTRPSLWVGLASCAVLLISYVYALREFEVSVAYATVTSAALVLVTLVSAHVFGEQVSIAKGLGILMIIAGIGLLVGGHGVGTVRSG